MYSIYDRVNCEDKEITEQEAENIYKSASCHSGPYGNMGSQIDKVLYRVEDEDCTATIVAIHYNNEWLIIPEKHRNTLSTTYG